MIRLSSDGIDLRSGFDYKEATTSAKDSAFGRPLPSGFLEAIEDSFILHRDLCEQLALSWNDDGEAIRVACRTCGDVVLQEIR